MLCGEEFHSFTYWTRNAFCIFMFQSELYLMIKCTALDQASSSAYRTMRVFGIGVQGVKRGHASLTKPQLKVSAIQKPKDFFSAHSILLRFLHLPHTCKTKKGQQHFSRFAQFFSDRCKAKLHPNAFCEDVFAIS